MQTETTDPELPAILELIPLLRLEGFAIGLAAITAFANLDQSWTLFAVLFLAPDLAMVGYAFGSRAGAIAYNTMHSYVGPAAVGAISWFAGWSEIIALVMIWIAHIGLDRVIGYGLKHRSGFKTTHLSLPVPRRTPLLDQQDRLESKHRFASGNPGPSASMKSQRSNLRSNSQIMIPRSREPATPLAIKEECHMGLMLTPRSIQSAKNPTVATSGGEAK